jgi:leader peptidase (prepilin peptidase)/N-methyltransferase
MSTILEIAVFIFGLIVGSFLNCVIYRLELKEFKKEKKSFLKGRSFCPNCKHVLAWDDLIPVVSFFLLHRRCRYCKKKISWQYPVVEISTALIFLLIFNFQFSILSICFLFLISCFLIIIFVYDLKHFIIPDKLIFLAIGTVLIFRIWDLIENWSLKIENLRTLENALIAALISFLFFFIIFALSRGRWMGFGDVKLALFMGLFLGWPSILAALFFSFFIGAIMGVILIISKRKGLKSEVPFGPFLILGTYIALFWGEKIVNWYLKFITL